MARTEEKKLREREREREREFHQRATSICELLGLVLSWILVIISWASATFAPGSGY